MKTRSFILFWLGLLVLVLGLATGSLIRIIAGTGMMIAATAFSDRQ